MLSLLIGTYCVFSSLYILWMCIEDPSIMQPTDWVDAVSVVILFVMAIFFWPFFLYADLADLFEKAWAKNDPTNHPPQL